jgi:hypothetical protein
MMNRFLISVCIMLVNSYISVVGFQFSGRASLCKIKASSTWVKVRPSSRLFTPLQIDSGFFGAGKLLTRKNNFVSYSTPPQAAPSYGTDDRTTNERVYVLIEKDYGALTKEEKDKVSEWGDIFYHECFYMAFYSTLAMFFWYPISFIPSLIWKKKPTINGWDLYGRVPFDDQFFRTKDLIKPDLFRKSLIESVESEKAEILGLLDRHYRITNLLYGTCAVAILYAVIAGVGVLWFDHVLTFE